MTFALLPHKFCITNYVNGGARRCQSFQRLRSIYFSTRSIYAISYENYMAASFGSILQLLRGGCDSIRKARTFPRGDFRLQGFKACLLILGPVLNYFD